MPSICPGGAQVPWSVAEYGCLIPHLETALHSLKIHKTKQDRPVESTPPAQEESDSPGRPRNALADPFPTPNMLRQTYSSRHLARARANSQSSLSSHSSQSSQSSISGWIRHQVVLPMPFRFDCRDISPGISSAMEEAPLRSRMHKSFVFLLPSPSSGGQSSMREQLFRNAMYIFQMLLRETHKAQVRLHNVNTSRPIMRTGTLLSLSLVALSHDLDRAPDYEPEAWVRLSDASELASAGNSWPLLTVRALAIRLVHDAVVQGDLKVDELMKLIKWCSDEGFADARRSLQLAYTRSGLACDEGFTLHRLPNHTCFLKSNGLDAIDLIRGTNFDLFADMLSSEAVPMFVLGGLTGVDQRIKAVEAIICQTREAYDALKLLETIFSCSCGIDPQTGDYMPTRKQRPGMQRSGTQSPEKTKFYFLRSLSPTDQQILIPELHRGLLTNVETLGTYLVSMARIGKAKSIKMHGRKIECALPLRALRGAAVTIMGRYHTGPLIQRAVRDGLAPMIRTVLAADLVVVLGDLAPSHAPVPKEAGVEQRLKLIAAFSPTHPVDYEGSFDAPPAAKIVGDISMTCEEHLEGTGFGLLEGVARQLIEHDTNNAQVHDISRRIAVDAAFFFAENPLFPERMRFAEWLERRVKKAGALEASKTTSQDTGAAGPGCHWDEGLCEWVAGPTRSSGRGRAARSPLIPRRPAATTDAEKASGGQKRQAVDPTVDEEDEEDELSLGRSSRPHKKAKPSDAA